MVDDDVLFRFRLRLFAVAAELGNVREACRIFGVHHSTYTAGGDRCSARVSGSCGRGSDDHPWE